jgi:hypothetical protein
MSAVESALAVGTWVALLGVGYWTVSTERVRNWVVDPAGRTWTHRLGVFTVLVGIVGASAFSTSPSLGVHLFAAAGALSYAVGVLAAAGAAATALSAVDSGRSYSRRVRAFWCAARVYHRGTRTGFGVALVAFLLAALMAALSVDPVVTATGAVALGGVLACVGGLTAVGVFVPATRNESVAGAVARTRS